MDEDDVAACHTVVVPSKRVRQSFNVVPFDAVIILLIV